MAEEMENAIQSNRINLDPKVWGSKGWFFLDSIILSYPEEPTYEQRKMFKMFFTMVGDMIPCAKCRVNYKAHLQELPLTEKELANNATLTSWWLSIQNAARASIGKKPYSLGEFNNYYNNAYINQDAHGNRNKLKMQVLIIVCLIALYFIVKKGRSFS